MDWLNAEWLGALFQFIIIDLTLAGDNAIMIGFAIILYVAIEMMILDVHDV